MEPPRRDGDTGPMDEQMPFCTECGTVGMILSGLHPGTDGPVRWTIYRCGHMRTEVLLEEVPAEDGAALR